MKTKRCSGKNGCGAIKDITEFHKRADTKDGYRKACKECENTLKAKVYNSLTSEQLNARRETCKEYYSTHTEEASAYNKAKYPEVRAAKIANAYKWAENNPERKREIASKTQKRHPEKGAARTAKYRNSKLQRTPAWVLSDPDELWMIEQFYVRSAELFKLTGIKHHVDHIYPLQGQEVSGFHCWQNLQILTEYENTSKGNKMPIIKEI